MIDEKSGVDLDEFAQRLDAFETTTPEERSTTKAMARKLHAAYPDRATRPEHVLVLTERYRKMTHFTTYPEDITITRPNE